MSLVDKYDDKIEPVFTRSFDREPARHQFRVSILLIIAMAVSAFVLGFAMPVSSPAKTADAAVDNGGFAGRLVTFDR